MLVDVAVAVAAAEVRHGGAPFCGVGGGAGAEVCGNLAAWEVPDGNGLGGPFSGVDAAADGVEAGAVGSGVVAHVCAPSVFLLPRGVGITVCGIGAGEGALVPDGAASVGVQRHLVGTLRVNAFDDVDFPSVGPRALP